MKRSIVLSLFLFGALQLFAQPGDPGGGGDPDVPITGIEILVGIGGALGARKLFKKKKIN